MIATYDIRLIILSVLIAIILSLILIAHNISKRQHTQAAALQQQAELLNLAHDTILVRDLNNSLTFWNQGAEEMYGWTKAEALGKITHLLLKTEFPQPFSEIERELFREGRWEGELVHSRKDGKSIIVLSRWTLQRDEQGNPLAILEINRDISQRKLFERELQKSESQFRSLVTNIPGVIYQCLCDSNWTMDFMSNAIENISGYPASDFLHNSVRTYASIIYPQDRERVEQIIYKALEQHQPYILEYRILHANGSLCWVYEQGQKYLGENNHPGWLDGTILDITERKQAEEKLKEGEERFRLLVESVKDYAIILLDLDGYIVSWNSGAEHIKGYKPEEIVGQHFSRFYIPEDLQKGKPEHELHVAITQERYEEEGWRVRKDGSRFWANVVITALQDEVGNLRGFSKVTRDITERKHVEAKLKESEERFRLLVEGVKDYALIMLDPHGYIISWNAGAEGIIGYRAEEIVGQHFSRFYFDEDVECGHPDYELIVAEAQGRYEEEGWRVRKDGSIFLANAVITALQDEMGNLRGFSNVTRDITERKQDEQRLRKWGDIFQHTGQGLIIASPGSKVLELMNPAFASMHGYTVEELIGRPISNIIAPECLSATLKQISLSQEKEQYSFETKHIHKNGMTFPISIDITNVRDEVGKIIYSIVNTKDITKQKQAEAEIRKALEQEKELGELKTRFVSMTSHEFRTPLATILSSTELLEYYSNKLQEDEKRQLFKQIGNATKRMTQLLEDVLAINKAEAGKLEFKPAPINLEKFCHNLIFEIHLSAGNKHEIAFSSSGKCTDVVMDEKLLQHILSNLLSNAIKYSPQGGVVEFELVCQNQEATFKVKDFGIGIPLEDQQKLFESFHRAQNVGNIPGTGLGLSIVKRMVDLHGGRITVNSKIGFGTTFIITIPFQ